MKKNRILARVLLMLLALCMVVMPALAEGTADGTVGINWTEVLSCLLYGVLTLVASVVAKYIVPYIKTITSAKVETLTNERLQTGINDAIDAVLTAVTVTNQTYVDNLKAQNLFDADAQKAALEKSMTTAKHLLTEAATDALTEIYGGVNEWLHLKIEQAVRGEKVDAAVTTKESSVAVSYDWDDLTDVQARGVLLQMGASQEQVDACADRAALDDLCRGIQLEND